MGRWAWLLAVVFAVCAVIGESHSCKVMGGKPDWFLVTILVVGSFALAWCVAQDGRHNGAV